MRGKVNSIRHCLNDNSCSIAKIVTANGHCAWAHDELTRSRGSSILQRRDRVATEADAGIGLGRFLSEAAMCVGRKPRRRKNMPATFRKLVIALVTMVAIAGTTVGSAEARWGWRGGGWGWGGFGVGLGTGLLLATAARPYYGGYYGYPAYGYGYGYPAYGYGYGYPAYSYGYPAYGYGYRRAYYGGYYPRYRYAGYPYRRAYYGYGGYPYR